MSTTALNAPETRTTGERWPLARTTARIYRPTALVLTLVALGFAALLVHRYQGWAGDVALHDRVGDYSFARLVIDSFSTNGDRTAFLPALGAALLVGLTTGQEWHTRRFVLTLGQSVSPQRWFAVRWALIAALFTVLLLPLVVLYRLNVTHADHLGLLSPGAETQSIILSVGPATLAYVVLGIAAGALAGTVLRNTWSAAVAGPVLTWLLTALMVRSRAALLLDFPALSKVHGTAPGGVLGLQFDGLLPTDPLLQNSLARSDYWPYQLAQAALVLAVAALLTLAALRVLRRRTGQL